MFSDKRLHRMSFQLLVKNLLSEEDCQALQKKTFRNTCGLQINPRYALLPDVLSSNVHMILLETHNYYKTKEPNVCCLEYVHYQLHSDHVLEL